ncbi:Arc family DNA-binding protein [Paenibacillus amylolyticus]|uniref:Arc family DNA-binding protein n=1 Tax=Paenibacillus TaxID=44249 RepID=UPI001059774F|nr:Arc family DNA-binding protein [Paenibacillus amylolyticus]TDL63217.1 Arc family DNA-binding protein [Paenibacillus amylolyticus]
MATDKRVFTLRLREKNFEKIKVIADKNKRSIAMQIEYLIEQHIEEFEKEQGVIYPDTDNDV